MPANLAGMEKGRPILAGLANVAADSPHTKSALTRGNGPGQGSRTSPNGENVLAVRTISRPAPAGLTAVDTDWRQSAACRDTDPELFFPVDASESSTGPARAVCVTCPVIRDCLTWALAHGVDDGIYGGLTPGERRTISPTRYEGTS